MIKRMAIAAAGITLAAALAGPADAALAGQGDTALRLSARVFPPGKVFRLDPAASTVGRSFPVGRLPQAIAVTPDGRGVFVANAASRTVTAIRISGSTSRSTTIKVGADPHALVMTPGGRIVYVLTFRTRGDVLTPIQTATGKTGRPVAVGQMVGALAAAPGGTMVYAAGNDLTGTHEIVTGVNTATGRASRPIPIGPWRFSSVKALISPNGKTMYVLSTGHGTGHRGIVTPVNLATRRAGRPIPVGTSPIDMAMTPNGAKLYVSNDAGVTPILTATRRAQARVPVGSGAGAIVMSPDGATAYVVRAFGGVIPVTTATNKPGAPIALGACDCANSNRGTAAITPDGKTLYVITAPGAGAGVIPILTSTATAGSLIHAGTTPALIVIAATGKAGYIVDQVVP